MTRKASEDRGGVDRKAMRRSPQRILAEVSATLASSLASEDILATVARQIGEAMGVFSCDIWEYEPTSRRLTFVVTWCAAQENPYGGSVGETVALDDWESMLPVVLGRETVELHRDDADLLPRDRVSFEKWGFQTTIDAPLVYDENVIGVLGLVETREERHFCSDEIELARGIGEQGALAFQNARLYSRLEHLAITDGLTGLYNHRYFYERLAQEVARAVRYQLPLSLLMLDVDDFKLFNDHYGHRAGDALLHDLGALLVAQTREQVDLVARYGGEEFAIILPSTGVDGATCAARRLRDAVQGDGAESRLVTPTHSGAAGDGAAARVVGERIRRRVESERFLANERPPVVTVSVGVASLHEHAITVDGLVDEADRCLYRAKDLGKNCVEVADN